MESAPQRVENPSRWLLLICAVLLIAFAMVSYAAVLTKSATFDENLHVPAAWAHLRLGDFRVNPEHPPLWKYWAALGQVGSGMQLHPARWDRILENLKE